MRIQAGFTTLTLTLIMLMFITAVTLTTGKLMVSERKILGNAVRYQEAFTAAQGALQGAISQLAQDPTWWKDFPLELSGATATGAHYLIQTRVEEPVELSSHSLVLIAFAVTGISADGLGQAMVQQQVMIHPRGGNPPRATITVASGMDISGNFSVVANPNGAGSGIPLSLWSNGPIDMSRGTGQTCNQQEYYAGLCSREPLSEGGNKQIDILEQDVNFPVDLLEYAFGASSRPEGMAILEQQAKIKLSDCSLLNTSSAGLYIVDGDCALKGQIGSPDSPIVLLVRNGGLRMNGNTQLYGLLFSYDSSPNEGGEYDIKLNGRATLHGAFMANHAVRLANGTFDAVYDGDVLQKIYAGAELSSVSPVPGSWRDF